MLKLIIGGLLLSTSLATVAEPAPPAVASALRGLKVQTSSLDNSVLRIVMDVRLVTPVMYSTAVQYTCMERMTNPKSFASIRIDKIEVLNDVDAQGFAFPTGLKGCDVMAKMKGGESEAYMQQMAQRCEAGVCRQRSQ